MGVCVGRREHLTIFGDDYDTEDGTGMRDYIHVVDLAEGHVKAIQLMEKVADDAKSKAPPSPSHQLQPDDAEVSSGAMHVFNLGTGQPVSVRQLVTAMEKACGKEIPCKIGARRPGDLPKFWAATAKAKDELGWVAKRTTDDM